MPGIGNAMCGGVLCWLATLAGGLLWAVGILHAAQATGSTAAAFLRITPGARQAAMGEAFSAVSDDLYAIYHNPAGLSRLTSYEFGFTHALWLQGLVYDHAAFSVPAKRYGALAFSFTRLGAGEIASFDNKGERTGAVTARDLAFTLGYGIPSSVLSSISSSLGRRLSVGVSAKIISSDLATFSANAFAIDAGLLYRLPVREVPLSLSLSARNIGGNLRFRQEAASLPAEVVMGLGISPLAGRRIAAETAADSSGRRPSAGFVPNEGALSSALIFSLEGGLSGSPFSSGAGKRTGLLRAGAEYSPVFALSLRAGYALEPGLPTGIRGGLGLHLSRQASFSYAVSPFGGLGLTHRASLHLRLGR